jgi:hypothetical protein
MVIHFKPNKSRTHTTITELLPRGRRRLLGVIRRTRKGLSFVSTGSLTVAALESVAFYMAENK